jgi:rod shape-determining protein MreC
MNKRVFSFFILLVALFVSALYYTNLVQKPIIGALNNLKSYYHLSVEYVEVTIEKHFFQARQIEELNQKLERYENNHLVMRQLAMEINDLYKENNSSLKINPQVELVRTISYQKFSDFNRIWINIPDYNASKIYGLTYKEYVAGIVIPKNGEPLGLLNRDIKSSYAVSVGAMHAPGIAHGNNDKHIVIKFIPSWFNLKVGDEVVTSGLDGIFFKGLKVGQVLSIQKAQGYQNAIVDQYYKADEPNYFHLIRTLK